MCVVRRGAREEARILLLVRDTGLPRLERLAEQLRTGAAGATGSNDGGGLVGIVGKRRWLAISSSSLFALRVPASKSGTRASLRVSRVCAYVWSRETDSYVSVYVRDGAALRLSLRVSVPVGPVVDRPCGSRARKEVVREKRAYEVYV